MIRCLFGRRGWLGLSPGLVVVAGVVSAVPPVEVNSVDFSTLRLADVPDPFYEIAVELQGNRISREEGTVHFHRDVTVRLEFAYEVSGGEANGECYRSEIRLVGLEAGEDKVVYFYLPPEVVERDRLSSSPPDRWRVSLAVGGELLPHRQRSYSTRLRDPDEARHFLARIEREAPRNDGVLLPIYLTPFYHPGSDRLAQSPAYIRLVNPSP